MITRKSCMVDNTRCNVSRGSYLWDIHFDQLMSRAFSRMYIIRICKYYLFSKKELHGSSVP